MKTAVLELVAGALFGLAIRAALLTGAKAWGSDDAPTVPAPPRGCVAERVVEYSAGRRGVELQCEVSCE